MSRQRRLPSVFCAVLFFSFFLCHIAFPQANSPAEKREPVATARLDLSVAGYQDLSAMARRSGKANLSVNFLDSDHVLFTFNPKKLFSRLPDCPPTHDDRLVHAAIFEVSTGKILKEADWYLHDAQRYLWPLGSGKVLLRRLNSLYIVDSELHEQLALTSPKNILWTSVTPDGKQIILETADDPPAPSAKTKPGSKTRVQIEFIDATSFAVQRVIKSEKPINLEGTSSGFASVIPGISGKVWLVRFGSSDQDRANIARVRSRRAPDVLYLSSNALLIGRDSTSRAGYSVSAFTITGNRLWRQHWDAHRYAPVITASENGSRFAMGTLRLSDATAHNAEDEKSDSQPEGLEQRIQVFNTASGDAVLSVVATPVVLGGQNFSLSPDGVRLALLRGTTVEIYDMPQMSPEVQAKYTAVKADVPGLYVPATEVKKSAAIADDSPTFTAPDVETEAETDASFKANSSAENTEASNPSSISPTENRSKSSSTPSGLATTPSLATTSVPATFKSNAQVVALDVVVADPKGRTVKGVPRQDFTVKEDGKPQAVNYFDEVSGTKRAGDPTPALAKKELLPNIFTNDSPIPENTSVTLILYDLLNTPVDEQQRSKLELLKFLQSKPKESRFALCALSGSLQMIQGFTPDESLLIKAAKSQKGSLRYTSMLTQDAQSQQTVDWLTQGSMKLMAANSKFATAATTLLDSAGILEQEETHRRARDLETRMWLTMDAFTQLARYLSAIPGRKSLIWLSGSFPLGIFPGVDLRNPNSENSRYDDQIKQTVNLLAEAHIALYPVDVRGLIVSAMQTPSFSNGTDTTQPLAPSQSPFVPSSDTKRFDELANLSSTGNIGANLPGGDTPFMQQITEHGIMDQIAGDTGGKAFYNTNGIQQAMAVAEEQETNYYALSYTPTNKKYDGKFRKIKVALAATEKKTRLIHRSGYFAVDPNVSGASKDVATGFGLAAMQHGSPQSHQILFEARVVPVGKPRKIEATSVNQPAPSSKKKKNHAEGAAEPIEAQHYAIDYAVTPAQLRFDTAPEGTRHGVINFMVTSFGEDGGLRTSMVSRATSNLKQESYQEVATGGLRLHQEVDIPIKAASLRIGVQDALTGRMGTLEIALPVKAPPGVEVGAVRTMPEIEPD